MKDTNYPAEMCLDDIQALFHNVDNHDYDKEFDTIRSRLAYCELLEQQIQNQEKLIGKLKMKIKESK